MGYEFFFNFFLTFKQRFSPKTRLLYIVLQNNKI